MALIPIWVYYIIPLLVWSLFWKAKGLWYSAKDNKKYWFIAILLINSAGILPIVYIYLFRKRNGKKKK